MKKLSIVIIIILLNVNGKAQQRAGIFIDAARPGAKVEPSLHGIFFEEISHGGEGGLYAELIQNRGFEESRLPPATTLQNGFIVPERKPHFSLPNNRASDWRMRWEIKSPWPAWSVQASDSTSITLSLTKEKPLNEATANSLQVTINKVNANGVNNLVNEGFWGINTVKGETYDLSFFARTDNKYKGPLKVSLQSNEGKVLGSYDLKTITGGKFINSLFRLKLKFLSYHPLKDNGYI